MKDTKKERYKMLANEKKKLQEIEDKKRYTNIIYLTFNPWTG